MTGSRRAGGPPREQSRPSSGLETLDEAKPTRYTQHRQAPLRCSGSVGAQADRWERGMGPMGPMGTQGFGVGRGGRG